MAEGLGVAASAVGIATAAIQSVQFLSKTINNIKDVPNIIKSVRVGAPSSEIEADDTVFPLLVASYYYPRPIF
jgi:hypothetical protein